MNPTHIKGANRVFNPPSDWDSATDGECASLPVLDTGRFFQSAWLPDPQEIACMQAGAPVVVTIWGRQFPPLAVGTGPKPGYVTMEAYEAAFAALRNLTFMCRTSGEVRNDAKIAEALELAEVVVGQIPSDARRRDGDPDVLKCAPPPGSIE